jgi:outer membrane protein TolC
MRHLASISSLAVYLSSGVAIAQPAPAPVPAPAPGLAPAPAPGTSVADPPKSKVQTVIEEKLHGMRSGQGLTADEAARRAAASSAQVEAKRRAIEVTEASISQTKYAFWPKLTLSASYTRSAPLDFDRMNPAFRAFISDIPDAFAVGAELRIPLSDYLFRLSGAIRGSKRSREAARADEQAAQASVARDTRVTYYEWVRSQAREIIALSSLEQARAHHLDATNAFQAGLVSKADVLRAEAAVKSAELFGEQTKNATAMGALALRVSMHDASQGNYQVGEDIFAPAPELDTLPRPDIAYREALTARAELKSLGALSEALRAQAETEAAAAYPRLDAFGSFTYANPNPRYFPPEKEWIPDWRVGATLTWVPTDIGGASATAAVSEARARELEAQARALKDGLRLEVEQALKAAQEARFAIGVTHHGTAAAEESYRVRRELFRAGRATLAELTDAEGALTSARLQMADAHVAARIALAQLHHALGRDQRDLKAQRPGVRP